MHSKTSCYTIFFMKVIIPQMSVRTSNCNDMGKLHFEECCIQYNNTLLMSVIFQDQQT